MRVTVREVAQLVGGTVIGDEHQPLSGINSLTEAKPGDISFLANPKYDTYLSETKATAVLVASAQKAKRVASTARTSGSGWMWTRKKLVTTAPARVPAMRRAARAKVS